MLWLDLGSGFVPWGIDSTNKTEGINGACECGGGGGCGWKGQLERERKTFGGSGACLSLWDFPL